MRHAARITLFVQSRAGDLDAYPDLEVLYALMQQVPLVTRNPDGSRTLVFDLADPAVVLAAGHLPPGPDMDGLRARIAALGTAARALGLPLTASLADAAEVVAEAELASFAAPAGRD